MTINGIVQKVWNFCDTLRDDGVGYGDYLEQITYLLFLKMAWEYSQPPYNRDTHIPEEYNWKSLPSKSGSEAFSTPTASRRMGYSLMPNQPLRLLKPKKFGFTITGLTSIIRCSASQ